jgi:hypothetical protein
MRVGITSCLRTGSDAPGTNVRACRCAPMSGKGGSRRWAIPEGYIPSGSVDPDDPTLLSHEAACLLNPSDVHADIVITIFFEDREPAGPYKVRLPARRTKHAP